MKTHIMNRPLSAVLLLGATLVCASGCKKSEDIQAWFEATGKLKTDAIAQSQNVPYRLEQHQALKGYFAQLAGMALSLKDDEKLRNRFNKAFSQSKPAEVCAAVLMERREWSGIVRNCRKNDFFLCAEEVRAYPEMVTALHEGLASDQRKRFDETEACRAALAQ
ncbi:MAG: hypothetical protein IT285_13715 [Bdellovibrionales bacterium]|nr:hypothetical protein [Bdellovibrionales bacterium]